MQAIEEGPLAEGRQVVRPIPPMEGPACGGVSGQSLRGDTILKRIPEFTHEKTGKQHKGDTDLPKPVSPVRFFPLPDAPHQPAPDLPKLMVEPSFCVDAHSYRAKALLSR